MTPAKILKGLIAALLQTALTIVPEARAQAGAADKSLIEALSQLEQDHQLSLRFDKRESGEPAAWQPPLGSVRVHEWARRWASQEWIEWQPRTRTSAVEALARFVTLTLPSDDGTAEPTGAGRSRRW